MGEMPTLRDFDLFIGTSFRTVTGKWRHDGGEMQFDDLLAVVVLVVGWAAQAGILNASPRASIAQAMRAFFAAMATTAFSSRAARSTPWPSGSRRRACSSRGRYGPGAHHEQRAQVRIAGLGYAAQPRLAARAVLSGHQPEPGGESPSALELVTVADVLGEIDADVQNGHELPVPSELMRVRTSQCGTSMPVAAMRLASDREVPFIR